MRTGVMRLALLSLSCAVAACGGEEADPGDLVLFAGDPGVRIGAGGTQTIGLTLARFDAAATGEVALSAAGLPAGVQATFSPATVAAEATTATMTLTVASGAPRGTGTVTVTAKKGALTATASVEVTVQGPTVSGTVLSQRNEPMGGITVVVEGMPPQLADAEGHFAIEDVTLPYTLTVVRQYDGAAHRYEGLSTLTPDLRPFPYDYISPLGGGVASYSGSYALRPFTSGDQLSFVVESSDPAWVNVGRSHSTQAWAFLGGVRFPPDDQAHPARFHIVLAHWDAATTTTTLEAGQTQEISLKHGEPLDLGTLPAGGLVSQTVAPVMEVPEGAVVNQACAYSRMSTVQMRLYCQTAKTDTMPVFRFGDGRAVVTARAAYGDASLRSWVTETDTNGTLEPLTFDTGVRQLTPAHQTQAPNSALPTFTVENPTGRPVVFSIEETTYPYRQLYVTTTSESVGIPDLSAVGVLPPEDTVFRWQVLTSASVTTMDEAATAGGILHHVEQRALSESYAIPLANPTGAIFQSPYWSYTLGQP